MWTQTTIGNYTNGKDKMNIQIMHHGCYILWKNDEYEQDFDSYEVLNKHLQAIGLTSLDVPTLAKADNTWHTFPGDGAYKQQVYSRKKEDGNIQSVTVLQFKDTQYSVYARETNYNCKDCLIEASIEFAEQRKRNPKDDLEVDAYEITTHGASGMDECHHQLKNKQEVKQILKENYGIE